MNILNNFSNPQKQINDINSLKIHQAQNNLTFLSINIRSIKRNFDLFITELATYKIQIDLIIFTEVWGDGFKEKLFKISGYNQFSHSNFLNMAGGVVIYCKQTLNFSIENYKFQTADILIGNLIINKKNIKIIAIYRSPSLPVDKFVEEFEFLLKTLKSEVCILGDININIIKPLDKKTKSEIEYENIIPVNGMKQMITLPTRISGKTSSCIDHIIFRGKHFISDICGTIDMNITDHRAIFIILKNHVKLEVNNYEYKKYDFEKIDEKFKITCWDFITKNKDVNTSTADFIEFIKGIKDEHSTIINKHNKIKETKINKPWISTKIKQLIKKRNKIKELISEHPNNNKILEIYKILRNKIIALIRLSKNRYYRNGIKNAHGNNKQLWGVINDITERNEKKLRILPDLEDKLKTANEMCDFFCKVGQGESNFTYLSKINLKSSVELEFSINLIEDQEIKNIIKELKFTKSKGSDDIEITFIKKFANYLVVPIKHIINCSFEAGIFPECLKRSIIVPIYKQGNRNDFTNYRPITISSNISKIFETAFLNRLQIHLNINNIINENQFGFRKRMGTDEALGELFNYIYNNINKSKHTTATFIDLSKAFDKVNHDILIDKLDNYGIKNKEKNWCKTFLHDRTISTKIDNMIGKAQHINWGVPQGSILGPVLFLIYINDIYDIQLNGRILNYADDCVIINEAKNLTLLSQEANRDISSFNKWCTNNRLQINCKKTKFINFSLKNKNEQYLDIKIHSKDCSHINCNCEKLEQCKSIKYLGIHVDENLKWNVHIEKLYNYLKSMCYYFYHIRNYLDLKSCLMVYYAMIHSHLNYGIHIWGSTYDTHLNKLYKMQKKIFKIMFKSEYIFDKIPILNIKQSYILKIIIYHKKNKINICELNTGYNLRNKGIQATLPKKEKYRQFFIYVYCKIFPHIPESILKENDLKKFKQETKMWILGENDLHKLIDQYKI
jgi:hypothetical protein